LCDSLRSMKTLLATSLTCSAVSLLVLIGSSAMSVAPHAEAWRSRMMIGAASFLAVWLGLAIWTRRSLREPARAVAPPAWLVRTVVVAGLVYAVLALLFVFG
jgi:uncharacterized membrane protein